MKSSLSDLYPNMEFKMLNKTIGSSLLWLLLSTIFIIFLIFTLHSSSSNPFIINTPNKSLNQFPPPSPILQNFSSNPFINTFNKSLNQFPPPSPILQNLSSNPFINTFNKSLNQFPPPSPILQNLTTISSGEEACDLFAGKWVRERREDVYNNVTCPTLHDLRNCAKYGKGEGHLHWRWRPDGCELPRFDAAKFMSIVRGKKMAFIGDSLARNHVESLACLLSQAETPIEINKDVNDKSRTWQFPSHDFTLMVMWTEFLVARTPRIVNGTASGFDVHLDRIDKDWADKLPDLNYVIISSGNWFFRRNNIYDGGKLIGCVSCNGEPNITHLGIGFALRRALRKALQIINGCEECEGLVTLLRTYTTSHFEHGWWFNGGYCNRSQPLDGSDIDVDFGGHTREFREIQLEEMERVRGGKRRYGVLDVTKAMVVRADGHPGSHWTWGRGGSDCLHWCLPGAIDLWSDLMLAMLEKDSLF